MRAKKMQSAFELCQFLLSHYHDRLEADLLMTVTGKIEGCLDDKKIQILYQPMHCRVTFGCEVFTESAMECIQMLTKAMDGEMPICRYNVEENGETVLKVEWDSINPEMRISGIVNGRAYGNAKVTNLFLYGNRVIEDYLEGPKSINNSRIMGIDLGSIQNPEEVSQYSEVDLYLMIDALSHHIADCTHTAQGPINPSDLIEDQYAYAYLIYQTRRFGVEFSEPKEGLPMVPTPSYKAWFQFYNHHFKEELTTVEWQEFQRRRKNGEDVSMFLPKGDWHELIPQFQEKKKKIVQNKD